MVRPVVAAALLVSLVAHGQQLPAGNIPAAVASTRTSADSLCSVIVSVRDSSGAHGVRAANVIVLHSRLGVVTDSSGFGTIRGIGCGTVVLRALAADFGLASQSVELRAGRTDTVVVYLGREQQYAEHADALEGGSPRRRPDPATRDTTYCWPEVAVEGADSTQLIRATVVVYRIQDEPGKSSTVIRFEQSSNSSNGDVAEFVALRPGRYLVNAFGYDRQRPLANWQPPPGPRPNEVAVGIDPWQRPIQRREFSGWREWKVVHSNCADALTIKVVPGKWVTMMEGMRYHSSEPPRPYRFAGELRTGRKSK